MEFLIITGLSGAGKSRAADVLEDLDYYCVDNMPVELMPRFAELCVATGGRYNKVAFVTDVREKYGFGVMLMILDELSRKNIKISILYMDADVKTLVKRYKESRRPHPLAPRGGSIEEAVKRENELLAPVKAKADFIVNTTGLTLGMLQSELYNLFAEKGKKREIKITVMSFGFKHGVPSEADLVFDVRFLPNPYYDENLRFQCGLDAPVRDFVFGYKQTQDFMQKLKDMIDFLLPLYTEEGKFSLTIAIGCTGGHHRSVALANALNEYLLSKNENTVLINRDLDK